MLKCGSHFFFFFFLSWKRNMSAVSREATLLYIAFSSIATFMWYTKHSSSFVPWVFNGSVGEPDINVIY